MTWTRTIKEVSEGNIEANKEFDKARGKILSVLNR